MYNNSSYSIKHSSSLLPSSSFLFLSLSLLMNSSGLENVQVTLALSIADVQSAMVREINSALNKSLFDAWMFMFLPFMLIMLIFPFANGMASFAVNDALRKLNARIIINENADRLMKRRVRFNEMLEKELYSETKKEEEQGLAVEILE